jgi:glutaredoxin
MIFIIYIKSNCDENEKTIRLLEKEKKIIFNCDQMIKNNISEFTKSIENKTHRLFDISHLPIIFLGDQYIGRYEDLLEYLTFQLDEKYFL